jgi:hypothetical protein
MIFYDLTTHFFLVLNEIPLSECTSWQPLGCFQMQAIMTSCYRYLCPEFSVHMGDTRSMVAGLCGNSVFRLVRNHQNIFLRVRASCRGLGAGAGWRGGGRGPTVAFHTLRAGATSLLTASWLPVDNEKAELRDLGALHDV